MKMMKYQLKKLQNGLRLMTVSMPVRSVTVEIAVDAGSRYETSENNGLSHFCEHMFFKGTKKRPTALDISTEVDSLGAVINAGTSKELTSFYIKSASKHLPQSIDILFDILTHSKFDPKEIRKEKGVILEEIKMREDIPMAKVMEIFDSLLYYPTPLGKRILGEQEVVKKMKRKDFLIYLNQFYGPERMVIVISGDVSKAKNIGNLLSRLLGKNRDREDVQKEGRQMFTFIQNKPQVKIHYQKTNQAHFCLGVRTFERSHSDRYALSILSTILGGSMSSRLFEEVREKRGLAYYIQTSLARFHETGHLVTQAGTDINKIDEAIEVVLKEYKKLQNSKTPKLQRGELKKAKEFLKGRLILSLEDSHSVADLFARSLLLENKVRSPEEIIKGIDRVTAEDIQRVSQKIFLPKNLNLAIIGPYQKEEKFVKLLDL
jgi:predicted Zn-dependent peptidase